MTDRDKDWLLDQILENAGDSWDGEDAAVAIAVDYVRHLEGEVRRLGGCPNRPGLCDPCDHAPAFLDRDFWGRLVRDQWVKWAQEQEHPKLTWLVPWEELDAGQREVDGRIGAAVAAVARERERGRIRDAVTAMRDRADHLACHPQSSTEVAEDQWAEGTAFDAVLELLAVDHG